MVHKKTNKNLRPSKKNRASFVPPPLPPPPPHRSRPPVTASLWSSVAPFTSIWTHRAPLYSIAEVLGVPCLHGRPVPWSARRRTSLGERGVATFNVCAVTLQQHATTRRGERRSRLSRRPRRRGHEGELRIGIEWAVHEAWDGSSRRGWARRRL
jgi:hypothetical protein